MKYYQPEAETMPREQLRALQGEKLVRQVRHIYDHVPFYRQRMDEAGVSPDDIHGMDDLRKLPFITKADLRDHYPEGILAVPKSRVVRIHSTSGTTGRRVIAYYTQHDLDLWEDCCTRALVAAGAGPEDICQIAYGYGLFTGGAGVNGASHKLGCMTIPMSSGNTERQLQFMKDLGTTVLCCTPSYACYLAESMKNLGISPDELQLKAGIFGAEPWTEEMRREIEKTLHIKAYDIYGLTELSGPGVAFECEAQQGMHVNEDHFAVETVDPDTLQPVPAGTPGEIIFTSLDKEAFPMIRYRTRDIGILSETPCSCGRTFLRMTKPMGRSDDMLIIRGVNVFPSQVETVLLNQGYSSNFQIMVDRVSNNDTFDINVEITPEHFSDTVSGVSMKEKQLAAEIRNILGINPGVHLVPPGSIPRREGKAVRIVDKRKLLSDAQWKG